MDVVQKIAAAVVAIGVGGLPLWVALVVAEARTLRGRVRALAEEARR